MKKSILLLTVLCGYALQSNRVMAQLKGTCSTCFQSQITKASKVNAQCTDYEIKVSYVGRCEHDLSHFTVAVPSCATISNLTNSQNYAIVTGYDPTTGLTGFKIDNTSNFGSGNVKEFTVSFRLCSNSSCDQLQCWSAQVAYKAGNCFELDSITAPFTVLRAHLEKKNISCNGLSDGEMQAIVDDGIAPFQYMWSNDSTISSLHNLSVGAYSVMITDKTGAKITLSDSITQPAPVSVIAQITNASCNGQSNGAIRLSTSGGNGAPYTYLWSSGNTTDSLINVPSGNYTVKVKDALGCTTQATFKVLNQKQLMINATSQLPNCNQSNGSLSVTATGGIEPYTYTWSNGDITSSISNVPQGSYSVTIKDAEGCSITSTYFLRENNTLRLSYSVSPTTCLDDGSGAINLNVSGGTSPYTFVWSNGSTTEDISGLTSGIYTVTVTDSLGCQQTARIFVYKKTFQVSSQITQPLCAGDTNGSISLTPSGGTNPYQYLWSTGATSSSIQNLPAGNYSVTVTDSTGCTKTLTYFIVSPSALQATTTTQTISCNSFAIDLTVTGGTSPYTYQWSTGLQTQDASGLAPGNYSVTITDANGCSTTKQVTLNATTWSCAIVPVSQSVTCNSSANKIFTSITDAQSYSWQLTSADGSWKIEAGIANDTLQFTAGNINTSATFSLTIAKDGCTQTCTYDLASCTTPISSGGGNNESCKDCFSSSIVKTSETNTCATYVVNISTDGNCRYDLSHFVIAIPCGEISNYSDSGNWPLVVGKDPTTGLVGLKVDNVNNFGKAIGSFTLQFTVCYSNDCGNLLKNWNPVVAYKAGLCIGYDTLQFSPLSNNISAAVYPNPFKATATVEVRTDKSENVNIEVYDQFGQLVCSPQNVGVESGVNNISLNTESLAPNMYFYRIKLGTSNTVFYGRIMKIAQ
jgi:hypothetical protein